MITNLQNKYVQKCISDLKSTGILFSLDEDETLDIRTNKIRKLENVVFQKGDEIHKICNESFFRHVGLICVFSKKSTKNKKEESFVTEVMVNDEMFYEMQLSLIEFTFKNEL